MRLTSPKRAARNEAIRSGSEQAYRQRLMGQLRKAHYEAKLVDNNWEFTVSFDRVKDETRATAALEAFEREVDQTHQADCSWSQLSRGTYAVTVTKR